MKSSAIKLEKGNCTAPKTMVTSIAHLTGEISREVSFETNLNNQ
jgi:hypothetical protein